MPTPLLAMLQKLSEALPTLSPRVQARALLAVLLGATALLAFRSIDDLDYGIHIGTGLWILKNGRVPTTDPFTWSIPEHLYVAYHWGFQVIAAALYQKFDHLGPVLLRFFLVILTASAVAWTMANRRVDIVIGGMCALFALVAAELRFAVRPELFTYLFLALLIVALDRWREGSPRALWGIPLIFVGWVNTHIYILGFVVLGAHLVEQLIARRVDRQFLLVVALSVAALFLNPYGIDAVMEPIRLFTRMSKSNLFAQHITELASPLAIDEDPRRSFGLTVQFCCWGALLALSIPSCVSLLRARKFADLLVICAFGALSLVAVRNLTLFVIVAAPIVATRLSILTAENSKRWEPARRPIFYLVAAVGLVLCIRVYSGAWYAIQRRGIHMSAKVERAALALGAAEFIERSQLKGRGFNNFNIGGTLILGAPSHLVYIDGRNEVTGEKFFRTYLEILDPNKFDPFLRSFNIEYVVLGHSNMMPLVRHLLATTKWTVVYYDAVAVVFVRKDGPNGHLPAALLPAPMQGEEERWAYLKEIEIHPSYIDTLSRWLLGGEEVSLEKDRLGTFLLMAGQWKEAERPLLESAIIAPNFWETSNNLGALYMRMKEWEITSFVYRNVLMLNPSDKLAREREAMSYYNFKKEAVEKQS